MKGVLLFCALYRSPNSDDQNDKSIYELFKKIGQGNFSHIIITGDMNFPGIDWKNYGSVKYDEKNKNYQFLEATRDGYLYQHVKSATRGRGSNKPSILDLFFTNDEDIISSVSYNSPLGKSDHCVLSVEYDCKLDENNWCKYRYNYERGNYSKMHQDLDINWEKLFSSIAGDVNEYWENFLSIFNESQENNIPKKCVSNRSRKHKIPLDKKSISQIRRKNRIWKNYAKTWDISTYREYCKACNQVRKLTRKAKLEYEKNLANQIKSNPKKFWNYVNSKTKVSSGIPPLSVTGNESDTEVTDDNKEKAELLAKHFSSVFYKGTRWFMGSARTSAN